MKNLLTVIITLVTFSFGYAQTDTTSFDEFEEFEFDDFGDADDSEIKRFCTQKVLYGSPTQLISIGYEGQGGFGITSNGEELPDITGAGGLRFAFNAPVVSRNNFILNLGLTYWGTSYNKADFDHPALNVLDNGLRTTGINATIFKPLNEKNFLIFQGSADANGTYTGFDDLNLGKTLTYSGTGIFGWKKDENTMFGIGVSRTYRAGSLLHIPVILYNKTFNEKWGLEAILPAKIHLRRNFGTKAMLLAGMEIEGNSFYTGNFPSQIINGKPVSYLRRGELKPRVNYQRQLKGFIWLSAQAGLRYNWRFDSFTSQNPEEDNTFSIENTLGNPLYFNVSINLVSP